MQQGKIDEAISQLQALQANAPEAKGLDLELGTAYYKKGEFELAVRALQRAAAMDPNNPTTHHLLGQAYRDMGKKDEAENELKLAEQLQTKQDSLK